MEKAKNRIEIFDIAKGLSIILMTLSHYPFVKIDSLVYPNFMFFNEFKMVFSMPMFIFISGYLLSDRLRIKEFICHKIDGLIKPIFGFAITLTVLKILLYVLTAEVVTFPGVMKYINVLASIFPQGTFGPINNTLWFVGALFWGQLVFKGALEMINVNKPYNYLLLLFLLIVLIVISNISFSFYYLEKIPVFFTYLLLGYSFKKISQRYLKGTLFFYSNKMILFPILFFVSWFLLETLQVKVQLNLYDHKFNYHYLLLLSILGVFSVLYVCRFFEKIPLLNSFLVYCSRASFFILAYHIFIIDVYNSFFKMQTYNPLLHTSLFILNIIICCGVYFLIKKLPYVRILFYPIKTIPLTEGEIKLLKSKYVYRFIPREILRITNIA
ncbi:hypothetical protein PK35_02255 [Tamlana nanhaiensis]|uniref:Acyltransferase 3 domain-containing protein n=1 Tax=Neotamlana nanhaiensis TaxID=1382798 RepID=A0A0D7W7D0_9FLAO|nr:acyltransferase [Tamlana nanhaiensis]KJD34623.1 hypothetical protein PK35_02255 [Tamlana nanhaiensis]